MYGREINGKETTFGTTGYTMNHVFVLYDRLTDSVWYPLRDGAFDAVAGSEKGAKIPFITKPKRMPLGKWVAAHPDTKVMLPPRRAAQVRESRRFGAILGEWAMLTAIGDEEIHATLIIALREGKLVGTWISADQEMKVTNLNLDGSKLTFSRIAGQGGTELSFAGIVQDDRITGTYTGELGELASTGRRTKAPETQAEEFEEDPTAGWLKQNDADGDGQLSPEEVPERMRRSFERIDDNKDGFLDLAELRQFTGRPGG